VTLSHRSQYFVQLKTFGAVGGYISDGLNNMHNNLSNARHTNMHFAHRTLVTYHEIEVELHYILFLCFHYLPVPFNICFVYEVFLQKILRFVIVLGCCKKENLMSDVVRQGQCLTLMSGCER